MKASVLLPAIVAVVIGAPVVFAADGYNTAPVPTASKDSPITNAVKSRLKEANVSSFASIQVNTDANNEVWLKGTVDTQADADRAVALAKSTDNVKAVHSDLMIATK